MEDNEEGKASGSVEAETDKGENQKIDKWILFTDGASNQEGRGAELVLRSTERIELTYAIKLDFTATNNEAEYEALLVGLWLAKRMKATVAEAHMDSLLVANQINGVYEAKEDTMEKYLKQARMLIDNIGKVEVTHVSRGSNKKVAALSKMASVAFDHLAREKGTLAEDKGEARKLRLEALQYEMIGDVMYRKSYLGPSMKCVDEEEASYIVREIHEGICGLHGGPKTIVAKEMKAGYYWPNMYRETVLLIMPHGHSKNGQ
ncbi:hypothetical protein L1987_64125 [Smallanthus sonchifolius]|uniref:Uncharacterized protein n=1 Tax=Smallanthus sonchifolius TaxID=185202 RepID=A0ACB9CF82_9ASTR|nr:hypothetical protein L1987_64125 [Smallanthus sonchifolius]